MFQKYEKCDFYYYMGLYLNEEEFKKLGLIKTEGADLGFILEKYDSIYAFADFNIHEVDKQLIMRRVSNSDNKYKEFCYQIRDEKLVLFPITVSYGIVNDCGKLLVYYGERMVRDIKLNIIKREGLGAIVDDMNDERNQVVSYNVQQRLTKVRNALDYRN